MYQRKVLRGEPHYNWGTNKMKKLNLKSKIAGGLLSLIPIGIRAAEVAPALTATTMSQASPQSATTSEVPFTSYLKILGPKALDFKLPKGSTSATVLVGDSSLTIKNNGDSEMPSPVEAVLAYVARTDSNLSPIDPSAYQWLITQKKKGVPASQVRYELVKGNLYEVGTDKQLSAFDPEATITVETGNPELIKLNSGKELRLTMDRERAKRSKIKVDVNGKQIGSLEDIFFTPTFYQPNDSGNIPQPPDTKKYSQFHIVFSDDVRVGGIEALLATLTPDMPNDNRGPYSADGKSRTGTVRKADVIYMDLTSLPQHVRDAIMHMATLETESGSKSVGESMLPVKFIKINAGYGSRTDSVTTSTTNARGVSVAGKTETYSASGAVANVEGRTSFEKLLGLYLAADANFQKLSGDYSLIGFKGKGALGILRKNLGAGVTYALSNEDIKALNIGDGFSLDETRSLSGPGVEGILRSDSIEARVAASFLKGNEEQTLSNTALPGFSRMTPKQVSLKEYEARVRKAFNSYLEADVSGRYLQGETSNGDVGAEVRFKPGHFELGVGGKLGTQFKGKKGVDASYQQLYGTAGFRF